MPSSAASARSHLVKAQKTNYVKECDTAPDTQQPRNGHVPCARGFLRNCDVAQLDGPDLACAMQRELSGFDALTGGLP